MTRFFVDKKQIGPDGCVTLSGDNAKHAAAVLRLKTGDCVILCDGQRTDYICRITETGKSFLTLAVTESRPNAAEAATNLCLFQSLAKSDRMELTVQKAVELGVSAIYPFIAKRSVADRISEAKGIRLQKIAESAAMQSGRGIIPKVCETVTFDEALAAVRVIKPSLAVAAHEKAELPLKACLAGHAAGETAVVFIGPEGGFTEAEITAFENEGIKSVLLGPRILRTETAGLAVIASILYELEG